VAPAALVQIEAPELARSMARAGARRPSSEARALVIQLQAPVYSMPSASSPLLQ